MVIIINNVDISQSLKYRLCRSAAARRSSASMADAALMKLSSRTATDTCSVCVCVREREGGRREGGREGGREREREGEGASERASGRGR